LKKQSTYPTDQSLADACARNDQRAQRLLYDGYVDVLYHTAYRYCFHREQVEDILQITFSKAFAAIDRFDAGKASLKTWLRRICINTTMDVLKQEDKWETRWEDEIEIAVPPLPFDQLSVEEILRLIEGLPREQRTIFNLYEIEGYTHDEIAVMLGINVNSCRVYLSRAKKELRRAIQCNEGV
jgi:RNA polymerase sigma factor (sigma-70 family)